VIARIAAAGAVAWALPAPAPHVPVLCRALGIPRRVGGDGVLLTFDDGPHPQGTPAVLGELDRAGVRALFFLVGEQVARDPGLAREIAAAGHELAVHGYRHRCLTLVSPWALRDDLARAEELIAAAAGRPSRYYRPPYGVFSPAALLIARRRGWMPLLWDAWGRDWRADATPGGVAALALRDCSPGGVLLLHDADHYSDAGSWRTTAAALPLVLDRLSARGLLRP
jgi:peptidoglycan/xylan/chitin deacetylase (PgdA/CDA1 family)